MHLKSSQKSNRGLFAKKKKKKKQTGQDKLVFFINTPSFTGLSWVINKPP